MFSPYNSIDFDPLEDFHKKNTQIKHFSYPINQGKLFCILAAIKITQPSELQSKKLL